jgi:hypothetical protein
MEQNITNKEFTALAVFSIPEVREYSKLLEAFCYGRIITKELVRILTNYCQMVNDTVPYLRMYFSESLPYLQKARKTLIILQQGKKELSPSEFKELASLFQSNLDNINAFFTKFNLRVEELSDPPTEGSNDTTQRTLQQRIVNPNYDNSSQTKNLVKKIVTAANSTRVESSEEMSTIAKQLKEDYAKGTFGPNQETVEVSELFLEGISSLYNDGHLKLTRDRAKELSDLADLELTPRQRKVKALLAQTSKNILSESKTRGN